MSRIGRQLITIPSGVTLTLGETIVAKGPKGELSLKPNPVISITIDGDKVALSRSQESKPVRALHGLYRALIANMIEGVEKGFEVRMEMKGVGYRATKQGNDLVLNLGYSHPITVTAQKASNSPLRRARSSCAGSTSSWLARLRRTFARSDHLSRTRAKAFDTPMKRFA